MIGNPLWTVPLEALSQTLTRPLFSPSRRPPASPVTVVPPVEVPSPSKEPDDPKLTLLGTIVGQSGNIAVVLDQASNSVVRLKTGQAHAGWTLRSVGQRVARFGKDHHGVTLALPAHNANQMANVGLKALGRPEVCADGQIDGPATENCVRSGPPSTPAAAQTSEDSRKNRWRDAAEAIAARRAR